MKQPKRVSYITITRYYLRYLAKLHKDNKELDTNLLTPILGFMNFIEDEMGEENDK